MPVRFALRPRANMSGRILSLIKISACCLASAVLLLGCSFLLPETRDTTESPWDSFDKAKAAYDQIVPHKSTVSDLKGIGYDPYTTSNVKILSYLGLIARFMPNDSVKMKDLDEAVRHCVAVRDACSGYEVNPGMSRSERVGDAFTDVFNFKRETTTTGWSFSALIVLNGDLVVYKIWRGTPIIKRYGRKINPLGPLQDVGKVLTESFLP